jgi:tetratricopeptide (TPR) repeat protein/DNA-binding winged helix-turn-helix (wHTH) protein
VHERLLGGFTLGDYHVDPRTGWLAGPGGRVHLPPRLLRMLLCLADKAPGVISHEDLIRFVWDDDSAGHERLSHAIGELRRVLHDHASAPRFIETLPTRGYRLMVMPTVGAQAQQPEAAENAAVPAPSRSDLFSQLRDRGVLETAITYLVAGWLLIQIAAVTFDQLRLPPSASTFITYLVIVGFPIAVLLAWFIELTPRGPVLDRDGRFHGRRPALSKKYVSIVSALALASVAVFAVDRYVGLPTALSAAGTAAPDNELTPNSIAVLRFANITGTEEGETLAQGLAEDIRNSLNRVPRLEVASRIDSFSLAPGVTSEEVRERLHVAYYLEGSVQDFGTGGRVAVNLIDARTGRNRFTRELKYNRQDFSDFIALQDVIAGEAMAYLRVALPEDTQTTEIPHETPGRDAYLSYRRGIMALYKPVTTETLDEAVSQFDKALEIYPDYAAAHAGLCRAYSQGYAKINDATLIDRAESACDLALADSAELDVVHTAMGDLYRSTGDLEKAKRAYEQALDINKSSVEAAIGLARVYAGLGDARAAEAQFLKAIDLQPPGYWQAHNELGRFYFGRGQYEKAARQYEKIVELDRKNLYGWNNLGAALMSSGKFDAALDAVRHSLDIEPSEVTYLSLGMLYYYRGDFRLAEEQARKAIALDPDDHAAQSNLGDFLTAGGDEQGAREAFQKARELANRRRRVNGADYLINTDLAWVDAMLGDFEAAGRLLDDALETQSKDPYVYYIRALVATRRGQESAALDSLQKAIDLGYSRALLRAEPYLEPLRDNPRFASLISEQSR